MIEQSGLSAFVIGIKPQQYSTHRSHEKADTKCRRCQQQRGILTVGGEKQSGDNDREEPEDNEVIPFERISDDGSGNLDRLRRGMIAMHI
jgi:hypothetical protein